ncbi:MAG: 3-methyl-2-oxobutanoate hydroxymethyltransferase [Planctomycetota bacterium]
MSVSREVRRVTTKTLSKMKSANEPIAMLTAYDFTTARLVDRAGVDVILVGDSAANVFCGHETTLPITLDQMIYHAQAVIRGVQRAMVVVDLPFLSFQVDPKEALRNAGRIMKETGAAAVKLEGGREMVDTVRKIVDGGIPVMGHLGLTPQSINQFGTYQVRAKSETEAQRLIEDAKAVCDAGCFSVVLEKIPAQLGAEVSELLPIPTIGIGAGPHCDGQVLVVNDVLGLTESFHPRFVRRYLELGKMIEEALGSYVKDVRTRQFPSDDESY